MKKLLSMIVVVFSVFFLVACQDSEKDDIIDDSNKELVVLTSEELNEVIEELDLDAIGQNVFVLESSVGFSLDLTAVNEEIEMNFEASVDVNGEFNLYANLESFENSYIYAEVEFNYEIIGDAEQIIGMFEYLPEEELEAAITEFNKYKKASVVGKVYVIQGVLYLDLNVTIGGVSLTLKQYEQVFTEEDFDAFVEGLVVEDNSLIDFDITQIPEGIDFKTYKVGNSYQFEFWLSEEMLDSLYEQMTGGLEGLGDVEFDSTGDFNNYLAIRLSNVIERVVFVSEMNLEISFNDNMGTDATISIVTDINLDIDLNGKMPSGLPNVNDFADYEQGIGLPEF